MMALSLMGDSMFDVTAFFGREQFKRKCELPLPGSCVYD